MIKFLYYRFQFLIENSIINIGNIFRKKEFQRTNYKKCLNQTMNIRFCVLYFLKTYNFLKYEKFFVYQFSIKI